MPSLPSPTPEPHEAFHFHIKGKGHLAAETLAALYAEFKKTPETSPPVVLGRKLSELGFLEQELPFIKYDGRYENIGHFPLGLNFWSHDSFYQKEVAGPDGATVRISMEACSASIVDEWGIYAEMLIPREKALTVSQTTIQAQLSSTVLEHLGPLFEFSSDFSGAA